MTTRCSRDADALEALVRAAEQRFGLWEGALRSEDRSQPLVSYRKLVALLARDAGYTYVAIADVLSQDHKTVHHARAAAANMVASDYRWWLDAKGALLDDWHEALDG